MRVVLGEDQYLLRKGLTHLLEDHGFELAAVVETGPDLLDALLLHRPDVALVDVRLPPTFTDEGLQAALTARRTVPGLPVLVLSQHVEQLYARELLADGRGGIGYLLKDRVFDDDSFIDSVRRVASGGTAMDPEVISQLFQSMGPARAEPLATLTAREREVLALMAEGRSNAAISERMSLSDSAVSKHAASIFAKLDLVQSTSDNRRVLAVIAYLNSSRA
ncbi:response regulator transcription factor [Streptomyces sp. HB132]|uniref:response regulator transcription factor n=1 Tax=Streptomyces sp. HB132 TaxID=767388 RepID=UPI00195F9CBC|nr:response regulator transcription factor [Streptomyces sp. HB132]MBM7440070.1 DNA-binding NarL/FixJ family response regulator [Streptomyces sp. HB132]